VRSLCKLVARWVSFYRHIPQNNRTGRIQAPLTLPTQSSQPPVLHICCRYGGWGYLHNLISVQPPRNTRSSSVATLAWPPTTSSLCITDRSFWYASPCLWNQLSSSLHQPHPSPSVSDLPVPATNTYFQSVNSPLSPSITTPSTLSLWLKTYLFHKSLPP